MDKILKQFGKEKIIEAVKNSNSYVEATSYLGLDPNENNLRKTVERSIKNLGISCEHFKSVKRLKGSKNRYNKNELIIIVERCKTYKEILTELNIDTTSDNLNKLKCYLYRHNIDYSHLKHEKWTKTDVWNIETLSIIVNSSKSYREVLEKMGLRSAGNNFYTLKKYLKLFDLNTSHFLKDYASKNKKIPLDQILVENSDYSRTSLKKRLYEEGLKERKCELCGQGEDWNGKHMSLILDHKNGVHNDNRLENLRIVCPNCNATLDTHAGKNNKKKVKIDKVKIDKVKVDKVKPEKPKTLSKLDISISRRKVERPSFDVLKSEINTLGYSAVGRKYGVSDNAIKKWVRTYEKYGQ